VVNILSPNISKEEVARYYSKSELGNEKCREEVKDFDLSNIDRMDNETLKNLVKALSDCRKNIIYPVIYASSGKFSLCEWKSSELELTDINSKIKEELSKVNCKLEEFSEVVRNRKLEILKEFEDDGREIQNEKLIIRKFPNSVNGRVIDGCHRAVVLYQRGSKTFEGYTFFGSVHQ